MSSIGLDGLIACLQKNYYLGVAGLAIPIPLEGQQRERIHMTRRPSFHTSIQPGTYPHRLRWVFMPTIRTGTVAALVLLSGFAYNLRADTLFSDLGPGNSYQNSSGFPVGFGNGSIEAFDFTAGGVGSYMLSQIDIALTVNNGSSAASVGLFTDSAGKPGTLLQSWAVSTLPNFDSTDNTVQTLSPTGSVSLTSGQEYWVEVSPGNANTAVFWNLNSQGATGTRYDPFNGGVFTDTNAVLGAFDVLATPVAATPEPGSLGLLTVVFGFTLPAIRRRKVAR